jgi:hypothetical protein
VARPPLDLRRVLTLGGQAPASVGALLVAMAVATLLGTASTTAAGWLVLVAPGGGSAGWLAATELWRLVTWPLFQGPLPNGLLTLLFAGFMLLWLGRQLSFAWSERRFLLRCLALTVGSGILTLVVATLFELPEVWFGAWPLVNALLVTWGLVFPGQRLSWFGALEMTGRTVALIFTIGTPLWALAVGSAGQGLLARLGPFLPHLAGVALAWLLVTGGPGRGWLRLREWWLRLTLERQRRRFKVITTGGPPRGRDWLN